MIDFYIFKRQISMQEYLHFICRLTAKAYAAKHEIVIHAEFALAKKLDDALWNFQEDSFIPHQLVRPQEQTLAPVAIRCDDDFSPSRNLIINLTAATCGVEVQRVIELVLPEETALTLSRQKYKVYQAAGKTIKNHFL